MNLNPTDFYTNYLNALGEKLYEAERAFRAGASDPGSKLTVLKKVLDQQIDGHEKGLSKYPGTQYEEMTQGSLRIMRWYSNRIRELLDAGPQGEVAELPELKDAYFLEYLHMCDESSPRLINPIRMPYSGIDLKLDLVTVWSEAVGVWGMGLEIYNERGEIRDRKTSGDLELPNRTGGNRDCLPFEISFREPGTQTIVLSLAGQEVRRFYMNYEDSRQSESGLVGSDR